MQYINCATIIQTPPALDSYLLTCYYLAVEVKVRDNLYSIVIQFNTNVYAQNILTFLVKNIDE
jgi:hypothetical protein